MMRLLAVLAVIASAVAFSAPRNIRAPTRSRSMGVEDLIGSPVKGEGGFFDPLKLSEGKTDEQLRWYRAAELKHGRVAMLASLGVIIQGYDTGIIPGFTTRNTNMFGSLSDLYTKNPGALIQIGLAISAIEVLGASITYKNGEDGRPGDFGWDPSNIRPKDEDKLDELQTKELKNGRLAMLGIAGMAYQTYVTGQGTIEQLASGHISPFGDGQGYF